MPLVGGVVVDVTGIEQRYQEVDVQQMAHGSSGFPRCWASCRTLANASEEGFSVVLTVTTLSAVMRRIQHPLALRRATPGDAGRTTLDPRERRRRTRIGMPPVRAR